MGQGQDTSVINMELGEILYKFFNQVTQKQVVRSKELHYKSVTYNSSSIG